MQRIAQRTGVGSSTSDNIVTNTSGGGDSSSSSKRWVQGDDCQKKNERPHWHFWREVARGANTLAAAAGWSAAFAGGQKPMAAMCAHETRAQQPQHRACADACATLLPSSSGRCVPVCAHTRKSEVYFSFARFSVDHHTPSHVHACPHIIHQEVTITPWNSDNCTTLTPVTRPLCASHVLPPAPPCPCASAPLSRTAAISFLRASPHLFANCRRKQHSATERTASARMLQRRRLLSTRVPNAIACAPGAEGAQSHTPVKQKGDCTSSRSIMTRPGATACRFSTCNTRHHALPLRLLLAQRAGTPPP